MRGVNPAAWQARTAITWHSVPGLATIHGAPAVSTDRCVPRARAILPGRGRGQVDGLLEQRLGVQSGVRLGRDVVVLVHQRDVERP